MIENTSFTFVNLFPVAALARPMGIVGCAELFDFFIVRFFRVPWAFF